MGSPSRERGFDQLQREKREKYIARRQCKGPIFLWLECGWGQLAPAFLPYPIWGMRCTEDYIPVVYVQIAVYGPGEGYTGRETCPREGPFRDVWTRDKAR
jgi:hypothetical protein